MSKLISDKIDFKWNVTKGKEGHYVTRKGSFHQDITIINIYSPDKRAPK